MLRFMGRLFAPADDGGDGGGDALPQADAPVGTGVPAADSAIKTTDMVAAIDAGLGYKTGEDGKGAAEAAATQTPEEKAAATAKATADAAIKERDIKAAAGDADAIKAKADAEAAAKLEAAKPKDLKALELTDAEKKAMPVKTAQRIESLLDIAKTERTAREQAETKVTALAQSRDAILGVLEETNTTDSDLAALLELNRLQKSTTPADMEKALGAVNHMRLRLMKALGKEGDGNDPLAEYPDLQKDVEDLKLTKERALELVGVRKREALAAADRQRGERQQQGQQQIERAREDGLSKIDTWCADIATKDLDFKAKEAILLPQVEGIIRDYPPNLWLPTIKAVYAAIVVQKTPAALPDAGGSKQPLRPSGAKPGGPAPTSMGEAIDQALGYVKG